MKSPEEEQPKQAQSQIKRSPFNGENEQAGTAYEKGDRSMLGRGSASKAKQKFMKNGKLFLAIFHE